jgi:hypothetical protein
MKRALVIIGKIFMKMATNFLYKKINKIKNKKCYLEFSKEVSILANGESIDSLS